MRKKDVPQHGGVLDRWKEICYATDDGGKFVLEQSAGWEPSNIANHQAWEVIAEELESVRRQIEAGHLSPLAFHMTRNQMDVPLLARYTGFAAWRVRRHLKPSVFKALKPALLEKYAQVLGVKPEDLTQVPEKVDLPLPEGSTIED